MTSREYVAGVKELKLPKNIERLVIQAHDRRVRTLKLIRAFNDKQARKLLQNHYKKNGDKWTSPVHKKEFQKLMDARWDVHQKLGKLQDDDKNSEFDSP